MSVITAEETERIKMALAEVGYSGVFHDGTNARAPIWIPPEVLWRARETALVASPVCLGCSMLGFFASDDETPAIRDNCQATRRFEQDCGIERSAS